MTPIYVSVIALAYSGQPKDLRVRLSTSVQDENYCEQEDGTRVLRLTLKSNYSNAGTQKLIVPRMVETESMSLRIANTVVWRQGASKAASYSNSFWSTPAPDPGLFTQIRPGDRSSGASVMILIPLRWHRTGRELARGHYTLAISIDHGPHPERPLPGVPWQNLGRLVTGSQPSEPLQIHLSWPEAMPPCVGPPVLAKGKVGK